MKTYRQVAAVCIAMGLMGGFAPHGMQGALHAEPSENKSDSAADWFILGQAYSRGEKGAQDNEEAAYYYRKAAETGDARAQFSLGMMYAGGRGVQKDFDQALYWIRQASGHAPLSSRDALVMEVVSWLRQASEHGYAPAQSMLEAMHDDGQENAADKRNSGSSLARFDGLDRGSDWIAPRMQRVRQDG